MNKTQSQSFITSFWKWHPITFAIFSRLVVRSKSINPAHTRAGVAGEGAVGLLKWVNTKEQGSLEPCQSPISSPRWQTSFPHAKYIHPFPRSPKASSRYSITSKARIWPYKSGPSMDEAPRRCFFSWVQSFSISWSVKIICLPWPHLAYNVVQQPWGKSCRHSYSTARKMETQRSHWSIAILKPSQANVGLPLLGFKRWK